MECEQLNALDPEERHFSERVTYDAGSRNTIMNTRQRISLAVAASIVLLMVLFPPYVVKNYKGMVIKAGHGFLFALPPYSESNCSIPATVNASQLAAQIGGVVIAGILVFAACKDGKAAPRDELDK